MAAGAPCSLSPAARARSEGPTFHAPSPPPRRPALPLPRPPTPASVLEDMEGRSGESETVAAPRGSSSSLVSSPLPSPLSTRSLSGAGRRSSRAALLRVHSELKVGSSPADPSLAGQIVIADLVQDVQCPLSRHFLCKRIGDTGARTGEVWGRNGARPSPLGLTFRSFHSAGARRAWSSALRPLCTTGPARRASVNHLKRRVPESTTSPPARETTPTQTLPSPTKGRSVLCSPTTPRSERCDDRATVLCASRGTNTRTFKVTEAAVGCEPGRRRTEERERAHDPYTPGSSLLGRGAKRARPGSAGPGALAAPKQTFKVRIRGGRGRGRRGDEGRPGIVTRNPYTTKMLASLR